jgi:hypothetical protein
MGCREPSRAGKVEKFHARTPKDWDTAYMLKCYKKTMVEATCRVQLPVAVARDHESTQAVAANDGWR